ncbi:MAG: MerR family transcriptional regulator, partial [Roseburia sp.]
LAIQQFGSIEKYTEAMKHNLEHFSEFMDNWYSQLPDDMRTEDKFLKLASHKEEDFTSDSIQNLVKEIIAYAHGNAPSDLTGDYDNYCQMIIDTYSNDYLKKVFDTKYGTGCCDYIVEAFRYYSENSRSKNN